MTEKKYMTASEFLEKKHCICFRDDGSRELYSLSDSDEEDMTDENILKELDAHFINKDLLKDKIYKRMLGLSLNFDRSDIRPKYIEHYKQRYNELEKILELLK